MKHLNRFVLATITLVICSLLSPAFAQKGDVLTNIMMQIQGVKAADIANVIAALNEADADASTPTNPADPTSFRDPISHACYQAEVKFLQSLPQTKPITSPPPFDAIVLFQRKRDFVSQLQAGLPPYLKLGCAALLGDEIQTFVKTAALLGVKIIPAALTGIFPAAAPITLPLMTLTP